jgi:DNA-binding LacI/PurR family transcriptional regulator
MGCRRIGLCLQQAQNERVQFRWSGGYLAACEALIPSSKRVQPLIYSTLAPLDLARWLKREKPDAIITGAPDLAERLQRDGWAVPDEIAVAMPYEDTGNEERPLACIDENAALNGATAVDLVAGMVYRNERGVPRRALQVMVPGEWKHGWSAPVA